MKCAASNVPAPFTPLAAGQAAWQQTPPPSAWPPLQCAFPAATRWLPATHSDPPRHHGRPFEDHQQPHTPTEASPQQPHAPAGATGPTTPKHGAGPAPSCAPGAATSPPVARCSSIAPGRSAAPYTPFVGPPGHAVGSGGTQAQCCCYLPAAACHHCWHATGAQHTASSTSPVAHVPVPSLPPLQPQPASSPPAKQPAAATGWLVTEPSQFGALPSVAARHLGTAHAGSPLWQQQPPS